MYLHDIKQDALDAGTSRIHAYVQKAVARGKLSETAARAVNKALIPTLNLADLANCEYVLEAATEDLVIKRKIIAALENVVAADCLIGFGTSGIPGAEYAKDA